MKKAEQFNVQTDVNLVFQSRGKDYRMRLLIEEGLIFLGEVKSGKVGSEKVLMLGEKTEYTGEVKQEVPSEVTSEVSLVVEKPKKKRKRKEPCNNEGKGVE